MKTKSTIKLFATAILATATISAVNVATHPSDVFASEVTQIPNKNNVGTRTTFETDPVFKNYEDAEKYLESYVKPTIEKSRYGYFTATVLPDGLGGKYLVEGFIDSHSEDEEVIKGNKETAQKIVDNASKPMPISESVKPAEKVKPVTPTPAKPAEEVKPATPAKPADEGKISNDIKEIKGKFTEIKTTSTGLTFKAKLPEAAPHAGPILPNIQATLTEEATGKEVAKTGVVLEGLSEELKEPNALYYSNLLEGTIFEPSLTPGNYILTVEGTTGPTYGQNTDKRKRHFVFRTEVTLTGEGNATITTQPEKPKDSTTKPKSDQTTNNVNNNQQTNNDKNKQSTNNNTGKQDKNELNTNKNSDKKTDKQNSDNTLSQEKQQTTSTSTKPENNKNNDKKTLPNTGESTSTLGIIGTVLSITGLGFIVKRKRG